MKLSLEGHGGEIIIGKLNDNEIEEWKKKSEEDISEEYDLSKLDEHTLGILEAMKAFI